MAELDYFPSESKRDVLLLIKRKGAISLHDAEEATGLARTTLREHLGQLERDGLVSRTTRRQGRGRPSLRYHLTPEGEALFPSRDGVLLRRLLAYLDERGEHELVHAFFERFWEERLREYEFRLDAGPADDPMHRLRLLEELLREQGFMPEVVVDEKCLTIRECNCPFPEAVRHTRLPCRLEARFFERIFSEAVVRVAYIPDGSPACTYEFPHAADRLS